MNRDIAITALSRILNTAAGVASAIITARVLGVDGRGEYFFVVTIALLAAQLANLGLPSSNAYFSAKDRNLIGPLLFNSLAVSLVIGPLAIALLVGLAALLGKVPEQTVSTIGWAIALAPCALFYMLGSSLLAGIQEFRRYNVISIVGSVLQLALLVAVALLSPSVHGFLAVSVLSSLALSLAVAWTLVRLFQQPMPWTLDIRLLRNGIGMALRAFAILLLGYLLSRMPVVVLGLQADTRSIGLVSVAIQFMDVLAILPSSVAFVLFPKLVTMEQREGASMALRTTLKVTVAMSLACAALAVISRPLISALFGEAFAPSADALLWALPGVVLLSAANVLGQFLAAAKFPISLVLAWTAALAVTFALSPSEPGKDVVWRSTAALSAGYAVLTAIMVAIFSSRMRRVPAEAGT